MNTHLIFKDGPGLFTHTVSKQFIFHYFLWLIILKSENNFAETILFPL